MDAFDAKFTAIKAVITGDAGAGGTGNNSATGYVRDVARMDSERRTYIPTYILIENPVEVDNSPTASGAQFEVGLIRLHVYTDRDNDRDASAEGAVVNRLATLLRGVKLAAQGSAPDQWKFTGIHWVRKFRAPAGERLRHVVIELMMGATRN